MIRTAECVSPMHPDKMCDRISDTLLDLYLQGDPNSRVAIETCGGLGAVYITGEVTSNTEVSEETIEQVVKDITGDDTIKIITNLNSQSPEISQGVDTGGAGDQGIMIGYACRENSDWVPQEYNLARGLCKTIFKHHPYDGKTQVTILPNKKVIVVASFCKTPKNILEDLCREFFKSGEYEIKELHCNPAGDWNIGGFTADAGVTGRKLAVDNYGPRVPLGGGAFSGKDATKVDRSAAYMARNIAVDYLLSNPKNQEVLVRLAYAIGYDQPLEASVIVDGKQSIINAYDLRPQSIIKTLGLKSPIFAETAKWGHMGNGFSWK